MRRCRSETRGVLAPFAAMRWDAVIFEASYGATFGRSGAIGVPGAASAVNCTTGLGKTLVRRFEAGQMGLEARQ